MKQETLQGLRKAIDFLSKQLGMLLSLDRELERPDTDGDIRYDTESNRVVISSDGFWKELAWKEEVKVTADSMSPMYMENGVMKMVDKVTGDVFNIKFLISNDQGTMEPVEVRFKKEKRDVEEEDIGFWS